MSNVFADFQVVKMGFKNFSGKSHTKNYANFKFPYTVTFVGNIFEPISLIWSQHKIQLF